MKDDEKRLLHTIRLCLGAISIVLIGLLLLLIPLFLPEGLDNDVTPNIAKEKPDNAWASPDSTTIANLPDASLILYGQDLISHTARYLGPKGTMLKVSNGMNCQNCHLRGGKKFFGNNFSAVASTYPKYRDRSGTTETIEKRVNDCIERSLNGTKLDESSREMKAFVAYIRWVGKDTPSQVIPEGAGLLNLNLLSRAADPKVGEMLYETKCARCHGTQGEGVISQDGREWIYPPLWGDKSFNTGAGILRLSRMAGYLKMNMPNDAKTDSTHLEDEEAWDIAAYISSMPRPIKDLSHDWPNIATKPVDHPFGPFADGFSEEQHRYGPFLPIVESRKK
jgi:thiosulfate dehydrogenase